MTLIDKVNAGDFARLFIEDLGWLLPRDLPAKLDCRFVDSRTGQEESQTAYPVAQHQGLTVWRFDSMPDRFVRRQSVLQLTKRYPESLAIFHDQDQQYWVWPDRNNPGREQRLTAHRHSVQDTKNNALNERLKLLNVRQGRARASAGTILNSLRDAFNADAYAAAAIADLHDALVVLNGASTKVEVFLTRILFVLFADDSEIFGVAGSVERDIANLPESGEKTQDYLERLFSTLGSKAGGEFEDKYAYVNGGMFEGTVEALEFDATSHGLLLKASSIEWSVLSPAIFGAMFQGVLEKLDEYLVNPDSGFTQSRDQLGAHYTSEANILKVIEPLFLEKLRDRFNEARDDVAELKALKTELSILTFLDPACGCGNFLVVTYKELRHLEHDILARLIELRDSETLATDLAEQIFVDIDQFFGIEIVESAAQIAKVALWIADHQMNKEAFERFGRTRPTIPLRVTPHIELADALLKPWNEVLPSEFCSYVIGNPPFLGSRRNTHSAQLRLALRTLTEGIPFAGEGSLDLAAGWIALATLYATGSSTHRPTFPMNVERDEDKDHWWKDAATNIPERLKGRRKCEVALVTTNSLVQGVQVGYLWPKVFAKGVEITFAYQSFRWSNNAPGVATVHCVIVGLRVVDNSKPIEKRLYTDAHEYEVVEQISGNLQGGHQKSVMPQSRPMWDVPPLRLGNQPIDGRFFSVEPGDLDTLNPEEANLVKKFLRRYVGADELLYGTLREVLWLEDSQKHDWSRSAFIQHRLALVTETRLRSRRLATRKLAETPHLWAHTVNIDSDFLAFPSTTSEKRQYTPIVFFPAGVVASNLLLVVENAGLSYFAVYSSKMFNSWNRIVSGRLGVGLRISSAISYNPFPFPSRSYDAMKARLASSGQAIVEAREKASASLADIYSNLDGYPEVLQAHRENDVLVDTVYGYQGPDDDASRFDFLYALYEARLVELSAAGDPRIS